MQNLVVLAAVGLVAQLVDGSLGMAYGVTSTTLLLSAGIAPAIASASVHLAEVGTTLISGASHLKFGNVDWRMVALLGLPGALGAFAGAMALSSFTTEGAEPYVATFLFLLGLYILVRFAFNRSQKPVTPRPLAGTFLGPLGVVAGFFDAAGGGGWGPISTSTLLASGRVEPRKAVGTIDTSEFLVSVSASIGFLLALGQEAINFAIVGALLASGVVAAPIAAFLVKRMHTRTLGAAVGGLILLTNAQTIVGGLGASSDVATTVYVVIAAAWASALGIAFVSARRERLEPTLAD